MLAATSCRQLFASASAGQSIFANDDFPDRRVEALKWLFIAGVLDEGASPAGDSGFGVHGHDFVHRHGGGDFFSVLQQCAHHMAHIAPKAQHARFALKRAHLRRAQEGQVQVKCGHAFPCCQRGVHQAGGQVIEHRASSIEHRAQHAALHRARRVAEVGLGLVSGTQRAGCCVHRLGTARTVRMGKASGLEIVPSEGSGWLLSYMAGRLAGSIRDTPGFHS